MVAVCEISVVLILNIWLVADSRVCAKIVDNAREIFHTLRYKYIYIYIKL